MPDEAAIRQYLLGEAPDEEVASLEQAYFASETTLDEVGAVEWDLIEDYLSARLAGADRTRFEAHYLRTPAHRRRLAMARGLRAQAEAPHRRKVLHFFFFPLAVAAILVLAVLAVVWGFRLPGQPRLPQATVWTLQVPLVAVRGEGEAPTAHLGPGVQALDLRLERGEATPPYALRLRTVEGQEVWRGEAAAEPTFRIPSSALPTGDYVAELTSGPDHAVQRYALQVTRP